MYDEVEGYVKGDWRKYSIHNDEKIHGFFGEYRWLSNFWTSDVYFDGLMYPSSETAYQAAKVIRDLREPFQSMSDYDSKNAWRKLPKEALIPNWDGHKYRVMDIVVYDKFTRYEVLKQKLLDTGDRHLEETNHWGDCTWGVDSETGEGTNWLGKILMDIRKSL